MNPLPVSCILTPGLEVQVEASGDEGWTVGMKRIYPDRPVVAVGAVVFVEDSVVLVRRRHEPGKGLWSLPGGVVELGETLTEAVVRELREEVGVTIECCGVLGVFERVVRDGDERIRYHYVIVDFFGRAVSGRPRAASDASELRLLSYGDVERADISDDVRAMIFKAYGIRGETREATG